MQRLSQGLTGAVLTALGCLIVALIFAICAVGWTGLRDNQWGIGDVLLLATVVGFFGGGVWGLCRPKPDA